MNNDRRKQIETVEKVLDDIKSEIDSAAADEETGDAGSKELLADREEIWSSRLEDARNDLEMIRDDEQEYYDNMPESLQGGDRGTAAEDAIQHMQECEDHMDELLNCEEVGQFTRMFNEKYDDMTSLLQDAAV